MRAGLPHTSAQESGAYRTGKYNGVLVRVMYSVFVRSGREQTQHMNADVVFAMASYGPTSRKKATRPPHSRSASAQMSLARWL